MLLELFGELLAMLKIDLESNLPIEDIEELDQQIKSQIADIF